MSMTDLHNRSAGAYNVALMVRPRLQLLHNGGADTIVLRHGRRAVSAWRIDTSGAQFREFLATATGILPVEAWDVQSPDGVEEPATSEVVATVTPRGTEIASERLWRNRLDFYVAPPSTAAAATLGRKGGAAKTLAKVTASRANGALGGRPTHCRSCGRTLRAGEGVRVRPRHYVCPECSTKD